MWVKVQYVTCHWLEDNFLQHREIDVEDFLEKSYFLIIFIFYLVLKNIFYNDFIFSYLVHKIKYWYW
jgi:hypothetical protein